MTENEAPIQQTTTGANLAFHWSYIILPLVVLILAVILTACFYSRLPAELAYHFQSDGLPDRVAGRGVVILWTLLPQFLLTLLAGGTTWGIARLTARYIESEGSYIRPENILRIIGNVIALPQIILGFAMLDIFLYNSYQIKMLPLWVFALIILVLGGIVLSVFFIRAMIQAWRASR